MDSLGLIAYKTAPHSLTLIAYWTYHSHAGRQLESKPLLGSNGLIVDEAKITNCKVGQIVRLCKEDGIGDNDKSLTK